MNLPAACDRRRKPPPYIQPTVSITNIRGQNDMLDGIAVTLIAAGSSGQNEYLRATWIWRAGEASPRAPKSVVPN